MTWVNAGKDMMVALKEEAELSCEGNDGGGIMKGLLMQSGGCHGERLELELVSVKL